MLISSVGHTGMQTVLCPTFDTDVWSNSPCPNHRQTGTCRIGSDRSGGATVGKRFSNSTNQGFHISYAIEKKRQERG